MYFFIRSQAEVRQTLELELTKQKKRLQNSAEEAEAQARLDATARAFDRKVYARELKRVEADEVTNSQICAPLRRTLMNHCTHPRVIAVKT